MGYNFVVILFYKKNIFHFIYLDLHNLKDDNKIIFWISMTIKDYKLFIFKWTCWITKMKDR